MATFTETEPMMEDLQNKEPEVAVAVAKVEEPAPAAEGNPTEMTRFVWRWRGDGAGRTQVGASGFHKCLFFPAMC